MKNEITTYRLSYRLPRKNILVSTFVRASSIQEAKSKAPRGATKVKAQRFGK
jgi:hypothetical protein